jgi:chromosomal replication initiator protein
MDLNNIWNAFLNKIKDQISPMLYETWFQDTKLYSLNNNVATVIVPMNIHKKHLKENYEQLIEENFSEVAGSDFKFDFLLQEEIKTNNIELMPETEDFTTNLKPEYTFESFVVGESNKFAQATSLAVAEKPGLMYNPLFIYGNSGLGKTHLMHAIGNYITRNSDKKVLYVTSEQFVNDFINITKKSNDGTNYDSVELFKRKYRDVDVLMIDDIQYLGNASQTQQEFFNTFNELYSKNKQIVISSDRSPDDLKLLEDRLKTRFNWGLTIKILPPDFKLRMDIIDNKIASQIKDVDFPKEVKEYIATNCTSDVRKLEGSIRRVFAYATMMSGSDITLELAQEALKDDIEKSVISKNKIDQVQQLVANNYNISVEDIRGKKRKAEINLPRQISMYICRVVLGESLTKIGIEFGGKDHTTVMHSVDKITNEIKTNEELAVEIEKIVNQIK